MTNVVDAVAALAAETVDAVSAAQIAETAAAAAVANAEILAQETTRLAALEIREVKETVNETEENLEWLKIKVKEMEVMMLGTTAQLLEMKTLVETLKVQEAKPEGSEPSTQQTVKSNADAVDPETLINPVPQNPPPQPQKAEKRHKML